MTLSHEHVVNRAINDFAAKEKPSIPDWYHLKVESQVQNGLIEYEAQGRGMTFEQLMDEVHDSTRLARHMVLHPPLFKKEPPQIFRSPLGLIKIISLS